MKTNVKRRHVEIIANGMVYRAVKPKPVKPLFVRLWVVGREIIPGALVAGLFYVAFIHATN